MLFWQMYARSGNIPGGHLGNARNVNWYDADFVEQFKSRDKEKTIYVY